MNNNTYKIINVKYNKQVGKTYNWSSRRRARSRAEKLNLEHGGYRYSVKVEFNQ